MKKIVVFVVVIILILIGFVLFGSGGRESVDLGNDSVDQVEVESQEDLERAEREAALQMENKDDSKTVLGNSVDGREILAYHYGEGDTELMFIGGIHGGYSWNTVMVAMELQRYLEQNPDEIPENVKVTVVPAMNPDGLNEVFGDINNLDLSNLPSAGDTVVGRFNANGVDLNRNFDCEWSPESKWQDRTVSGGDSAFSEPESIAIKNYVEANNPDAIVTWYSAAGGVFSSNCSDGSILTETGTITNLYADASGYKAYEEFDFYEINGDMVNWFAKRDIPAISVLLTNHRDIEWNKNREGIEALLDYYAN